MDMNPALRRKAQANVLFGQAPKLEAFWDDGSGSGPTAEQMTWEVTREDAPLNADPDKSLYPAKPELMFTGGITPYQADNVQFQTVHTGTFVLKACTTNGDHKGSNGQPASIEITFDVEAPMSLGAPSSGNHRYDGLIIYYADKYGIPPQYIKSQANNESGLNASAFRYELRTIDRKSLSAYDGWANAKWNLDYYQMPASQPSSHLFPEDIQPRHIYDVTDFHDAVPPAWPYTCHELDYPSPYDPVALFRIYEADDGWPCLTYPWQVYNPQAKDSQGNWNCGLESPLRTGPCQRLGWYDAERAFNSDLSTTVTYMRHTNTFYCGWISSRPCAPTETESQWLMNNGTYIAQTPVASSYGLIQVLYTTAVQKENWLEGEGRGDERHPSYLFDPDTNLDLGVGYDADRSSCVTGGASQNFPDRTSYEEALKKGFGAYNNGNCASPAKAYGQAVVSNAGQMMPY